MVELGRKHFFFFFFYSNEMILESFETKIKII